MSWLKLDDNFSDHPKVARLSDRLFRAHVSAMCWCARFRTDGKMPREIASKFAGTRGVRTLVEFGLWEAFEQGFLIHDFSDYNPTKGDGEERDETLRNKRSEAGKKGANKRWGNRELAKDLPSDANSNAIKTDSKTMAKRWQLDSPVPVPQEEDKSSSVCHGKPQDDDPTVPCPSDPVPDSVQQELANHYGASLDDIQAALKDFRTYWTVGKGAGQRFRRGMWIRKFRERCQWLDADEKLKSSGSGNRAVLSI